MDLCPSFLWLLQQITANRWFKTTEMYSLIGLEAMLPLETLGEAFLVSSVFLTSLACGHMASISASIVT